MHVTYCYHCEGPHTLYYNDRQALLFLSLSLTIIKNAPQIQQPDTASDFSNIKKRNIWESPIYQEASAKISSNSDHKQRSYSIFSNEVKIAKFSKIFASCTPKCRRFRLFIVIL